MNISKYVRNKISEFQSGEVFTYAKFNEGINNKNALIKALNRLVVSGIIIKLAKGKFYKGKETVFGKLKPNQHEIVKDLLESNGEIIGYLTGYSIYNELGFTTQVSNVIQIGRVETRPAFKRDYYCISFVKQKNQIKKNEIPLLQILDVIRYIKKIPDTTVLKSCKRLMAILKDLTKTDKLVMIRLAMKYPPSTRALLGAILDEIGDSKLIKPLQESLNQMTTYGFNKEVIDLLKNSSKWNLK